MTLLEISEGYAAAAVPLRARLRELNAKLKAAEDPDEIWHLKRRIYELTPLLTEMNELYKLTANYYERGFYRGEKYTFCGVRGYTSPERRTVEAYQKCSRK